MKPYYVNSKMNSSVYYYMVLAQNQVILNDSPLFGAEERVSFIETRIDYSVISEIPDGEGTTNAYIGFYI